MENETGPSTSERLMTLLGPLHDRAQATARRLSRNNADGDDLFQESVLRAYDKIGDLRDDSRFRSWFFAILLSVHRQRHRRDFWRRLLPLDAATEPSTTPDVESEGAERMSRALAALGPKDREVLVLFELEGFSLEEIAELQRASLSAVKSRLSRARARLRRSYERNATGIGRLAMEKLP